MPRTNNKSIEANENLKSTAKATFQQNSPLVETVKMITKGLIPEIPKEITIRAIQRKDKKKLLMGNVDDPLLSLLQECIVAPNNFNVYNLLGFEAEYLLYRLRVLTYGADYTFKEDCPYCRHLNDVNIDLSNIPIVDVPDDFTITFDISLPVSGDVLTCKLLTEGEKININKSAKQFKEEAGNQTADIDMIWESRIIAINGDSKIAPIEISQYLDNMNDYDSEYFMEYYVQKEGNYGLQTKLKFNCDNCGKFVESNMPSIYTFFRPKFTFDTTK